jgi:hypothetical protein
MMTRNIRLFQAVYPATVWTARAGPLTAAGPAFEPNSPANRAR